MKYTRNYAPVVSLLSPAGSPGVLDGPVGQLGVEEREGVSAYIIEGIRQIVYYYFIDTSADNDNSFYILRSICFSTKEYYTTYTV